VCLRKKILVVFIGKSPSFGWDEEMKNVMGRESKSWLTNDLAAYHIGHHPEPLAFSLIIS